MSSTARTETIFQQATSSTTRALAVSRRRATGRSMWCLHSIPHSWKSSTRSCRAWHAPKGDYRTAFKRSVVIDLVCFRKHGHQEQDTPSITQPLMYRSIASHPSARTIYARQLIQEGVVTSVQVDDYVNACRDGLERARKSEAPAASIDPHEIPAWPQFLQDDPGPVTYGPPLPAQVRALAKQISTVPDGVELHPLVGKMMAARREMAAGRKPIDWGMGEHLAFASLLGAGVDVRLSGQDSARGTFNHRHAVLHNQRRTSRSDGVYIPLEHVDEAQG